MDSSIFESGQNPLFQTGFSVKSKNRMANNVEPDEVAHNEPSHQNLHCLHKICFGLQGGKGLSYGEKKKVKLNYHFCICFIHYCTVISVCMCTYCKSNRSTVLVVDQFYC